MPNPSTPFDLGTVGARLAHRAEAFLALLPLVLLALLVLWFAWKLGGWLSRRSILNRAGRRNPFLQDLLRTTVRWATLALGLVIALEIVGATRLVGAVLGTAGVLGVALGFAFKDILENYLAGVLMSLRQPFSPRDHVVIDGNEGIVTAMTSRATILMTLQGNHLRLPNATVFGSVILNYTRNPLRRLEFDAGIGTGESLLHAQAVGLDALRGVDGVAATPPVRAEVRELADSTVTVRYSAWVDQSSHDFLLVRSEAIRTVKEALDAADIALPNPTYDLNVATALDASASPLPAAARNARSAGPVAARGLPPVDTRRTHDVMHQIEADARIGSGEDLLHASAPKE